MPLKSLLKSPETSPLKAPPLSKPRGPEIAADASSPADPAPPPASLPGASDLDITVCEPAPDTAEDYSLRRILELPEVKHAEFVGRQSIIKAAEFCHRLAAFRHWFGLRKLEVKSARDSGSYGHLVMNLLLSAAQKQPKKAVPVKTVMAAVETTLAAVLIGLKQEYGDPLPMEIVADATQAANVGLAMGLRGFAVIRPHLQSGRLRIVASELPFESEVELPIIRARIGGDFILQQVRMKIAGTIDFLVQNSEGELWIFDFKTTSKALKKWLTTADRRLQPIMYTHGLRADWAVDNLPASATIKGFIYLLLQAPTIKRKGQRTRGTPQSLEDYLLECNEWWDGTGRWAKLASDRRANPPVLLHDLPIADRWDPAQALRLVQAREILSTPRYLFLLPPRENSCAMGNMECDMNRMCCRPTHEWAEIGRRHFTTTVDPLLAGAAKGLPLKAPLVEKVRKKVAKKRSRK